MTLQTYSMNLEGKNLVGGQRVDNPKFTKGQTVYKLWKT